MSGGGKYMRLFTLLMVVVAMAVQAEDIDESQVVDQKSYGSYFEQIEAAGQLDNRKAQYTAWMRLFVGRPDYRVDTEMAFVEKRVKQCDIPPSTERVPSPFDFILSTASKFDLLAFNESHHESRTRYFLIDRLEELWAAGYRHIGFEGLNRDVRSISEFDNMEEMPSFYAADPMFGAMIRRAFSIGFKVFSYDYRGPYPETDDWKVGQKLRETKQAESIANYVSQVSDGERIVIWAGFQHVSKALREDEGVPNWMAANLKTLHGIEAYAVDTTICSYEAADARAGVQLYVDEVGTPVLSEKGRRWVVDAQLHLLYHPSFQLFLAYHHPSCLFYRPSFFLHLYPRRRYFNQLLCRDRAREREREGRGEKE